ncbi:helix-turn-helix domain-containing protein [Pseudoneobacillus sp. C159]
MLGERIRKIRKQKKMTLETLAGKELTKGMLSLIENNKAKPSMESLSYIAEQLEVDVTELLGVIDSQELRDLLEQAEKLYHAERLYRQEKGGSSERNQQIITLIEPYVEHLTQGYEAARLLEIYGYSLYFEKSPEWRSYIDRAANMYDQMNITSKRAKIGIFRSTNEFSDGDYARSLVNFLAERKEIETHHAYIDPMTRLDLDYNEAVAHFAVGNSELASQVMERAFQFSKKEKIFYRIDDLYRLAAAHAVMSNHERQTEYYIRKLQQYGEFAEYRPAIIFCRLLSTMLLISVKREYSKAIEEINDFFSEPDKMDGFEPWFYLEKGKALYYLGHYGEALETFDMVEIPVLYHPYDLSIFFVMFAYKALVFHKLGKCDEAREWATKAVEKFAPLPETSFKIFSLDAYREMMKG